MKDRDEEKKLKDPSFDKDEEKFKDSSFIEVEGVIKEEDNSEKKTEEKVSTKFIDEVRLEDNKLSVELLTSAGCGYGSVKVDKTIERFFDDIIPNQTAIVNFIDKMAMINLNLTKFQIEKAVNFLRTLLKKGNNNIVFVGSLPHENRVVEEIAKYCGSLYVSGKWTMGLLTNWQNTLFKIKKIHEFKSRKAKDEKFSPKELSNFEKEHEKLKGLLSLRSDSDLPHLLIISSSKSCSYAIQEAEKKNIPFIVILDTDEVFKGYQYGILANNKSSLSLSTIFSFFKSEIIIDKRRYVESLKN